MRPRCAVTKISLDMYLAEKTGQTAKTIKNRKSHLINIFPFFLPELFVELATTPFQFSADIHWSPSPWIPFRNDTVFSIGHSAQNV